MKKIYFSLISCFVSLTASEQATERTSLMSDSHARLVNTDSRIDSIRAIYDTRGYPEPVSVIVSAAATVGLVAFTAFHESSDPTDQITLDRSLGAAAAGVISTLYSVLSGVIVTSSLYSNKPKIRCAI